MLPNKTVLLVGGSGRTGSRVMQQLLDRNIQVRAIVRAGSNLPRKAVSNANLSIIEASLLSLTAKDLQKHLSGCDAVISCLGHVLSFKGVFGPPHYLVTQATSRLCRSIETLQPAEPIKFILMSSVSVHQAKGQDTLRGLGERVFLGFLRAVLPPAKDNQRAADHLIGTIGKQNPYIEWAVVRPDSLLAGEVSEYTVHEALVNKLFKPGHTNMANVAHFMCELITDPQIWTQWMFKLPVIVNKTSG